MRAVAILLVLAVAGGCSDAVDPTLGTAQAFSLYGYLDPTADQQAIRVAPITGVLGADTLRSLSATVSSVERGTGRTAVWRDSVVDYRDGSVGHVFVADYTPTPGATVDLRVEETVGDRRVTTVEVEVPPLQQPVLEDAITTGVNVIYPIRVQAPRVLTAELVFRVVGLRQAPEDTVAVAFSDVAPFLDAGGGTWALDLDFLPTARAFLASPAAGASSLRLVDVEARAFVTGPQWDVPPGGLNEDRVVEPGTFSNVVGGFGFVGSGFWTSTRWVPSLAAQQRSGFVVDVDPASALAINEVSAGGWVELFNPTLETLSLSGYQISSGESTAAFPDLSTIGPRGFAVLQVAPSLSAGTVALERTDGTPIVELTIEDLPGIGTFGSYPDGRSRLIGEFPQYRGLDLFKGVLIPTRGAPNRPRVVNAVVNEVFSAGSDGWVELVHQPGVDDVIVSDDAERPIPEWSQARLEGDLWVAEEAPGRLQLDQSGGEILVIVQLMDTPPRVTEVRTYGPQNPTQSSGLLPDGDRAGWQMGLRPTRGLPNALARFGL